MQIFREIDYLLRKTKILHFLLVTAKLVKAIQPGRKKEHPDRSRNVFISLLHFKLKAHSFNRERGK